MDDSASRRHVRLVTERTVEHFLRRLLLRDATMRNLCLIAPFINTMDRLGAMAYVKFLKPAAAPPSSR